VTDPDDHLTPEQQQQVDDALTKARTALKSFSVAGMAGAAFRGFFRRMIPRPRVRRAKFLPLAIGLVVVVSSLVTCSAGVNLDKLMAEYGEPVPATRDAAQQFVARAATAVQRAAASRRLRITISEEEATSALSLGLLFPELMQAMDSLPPEALQEANDIEELREILRRRQAAARDSITWRERVAGILDPRLRTGDVQVRFTASGQVVVAGYVQAWRFRQPGLVVFAPRAQRGELELDFVKGRLGRMPAPAWGFDMLGRLMASLILLGDDYAEISNITVTDGRLTFEAAAQP
jgi:hypothetical protein